MGADQSCCGARSVKPSSDEYIRSKSQLGQLVKPAPEPEAKSVSFPSLIDRPIVKPDLAKHYGPGLSPTLRIIWILRNDKLVVTEFPNGSLAKKLGVMPGDILKSVDEVEILHLKSYPEGKHPAGDLMLGTYGTHCKMVFLRVSVDSQDPQQPQQSPQLMEVSCVLPRIILVPSSTSPSATGAVFLGRQNPEEAF